MPLRRVALLLSGLALAGCAAPADVRQVQQAQLEADRFNCLEQGFQEDTESFALCRLILQTNRRVDALSREVRFLEHDIRRADLRFPYRRWR